MKQLLQVDVRGYRLADFGQRMQLNGMAFQLPKSARPLDGSGHLVCNARKETHLVARVLSRAARAHVDNAQYLATRDKRHRKHGLKLAFVHFGEKLKAMVFVGIFTAENGFALTGDPTGDALSHFEAYLPHQIAQALVGRPQHQLLPIWVEQIDLARIGSGDAGGDIGRDLKHLLKVERGTGCLSYPSQGIGLRVFLFELRTQLFDKQVRVTQSTVPTI